MSYTATAPGDEDKPLSEQDDVSLAAAVAKCISQADKRHRAWRDEASECYAMRDGDQWNPEDETKLREEGRPPVTFNRLGVLIDAVCGAQVNNRQEMKFLPRTIDDQGLADVVQGVVNWARDQCDAEDQESDAFRDLATCGMGWLVNRVDYTDDPQGLIVKDRVSPLEMRWDPASKKKNLEDARWLAHVKKVPADEVQAQWPQFEPGMAGSLSDQRQMGVTSRPVRDQYADEDSPTVEDPSMVEIVEYQWRETQRVWAVSDPNSGRVAYMPAERWKAMHERFGERMQRIKAVPMARSRWFRAIVAGETVLERGECPDPEAATYQCMTGKRDERAGCWYGIVRGLMDPQRWANKWLSQSMHILNTSAKSGVFAEEGAIPDERRFAEEYAKPGSLSIVAPGALSGGRVVPKNPPGMPPGFEKLLQFAVMSIPDISGINREVLGLADREQAGVLEAQRKQAAQAVLAPLFDALRLYYKRDGRQMARMVATYVSPERQIRIIGEDTQEPRLVSTAMLPDVREFDIVVDEAPTSPNQKAEVWQFMAPALPGLMKAGIPPSVWIELLKFSPLPESAVNRIADTLKQQEQAAAQQPDPEVMKLQMQAQADQQRMQFEQQKNEQDLALERERFALEQAKAQFQLQHEAQKLEFQKVAEAQKLQIQREQAAQDADIRAYEVHTSAEAQKASALPAIVKPIQQTIEQSAKTAEALARVMDQVTARQSETTQIMAALTNAFGDLRSELSAPLELTRGADGRVSGARRGSRTISLQRSQ